MRRAHRHLRAVVCLAVGLCLAAVASAAAEGGPERAQHYYYSDGSRIELTPSTGYAAVRFHAGTPVDLAAEYPDRVAAAGERDLSAFDLVLLRLRSDLGSEEIDAFLAGLRHRPEIRLVAPVFDSPGALMIVTDRFLAAFTETIRSGPLADLNALHDVETVERVGWAENTFELRAREGDALAVANLYHELPEVAWAHPDFVRVFDRRATVPRRPDERLVLGPRGEVLAPDTPVEKGEDRLRVIEPGKMTLPEPPGSSESEPDSPVTRSEIKREGFEGSWPNDWDVGSDPTWSPTTYRAHTGSWSGYCVGSTVAPPGPYPNNAVASMIYGPFSLVDAVDARLDVQAWISTEPGFDSLGIYASTDGTHYYGAGWSGGWAGWAGGDGFINIAFDLEDVYVLGDLTGEPQVWVSLNFFSDSSVVYEGVYVDEVVVEKITGGYQSLTSDVHDHMQWSLDNHEQLWGVEGADIDVVPAWGVTHGDSSVIIAVIDEGVDLTHPDLAVKLLPGKDTTGHGGGGGPTGDDAHGTNCAGIAAALTDNALGVAGVDRLASILPVRSLYDGSGQDSWLAEGLTWATDNGGDVLSNSWGGGLPSTAITNAIAHAKTSGRGGKGAVVVFAAGNDNAAVSYPASLSSTLAVGALSPCDERKAPRSCDGEYWWGSNYGSELDVMAPGVHMYSTDIQGANGYSGDDYFDDFNGTSSAAPVVSGVAGLILSLDPTLTGVQVEDLIRSTATDLGTPGRDDETGWGRVDAYDAVGATSGGIPMDLYLTGTVAGTEVHQACNSITTENWSLLAPGGDVTLQAGGWVQLNDGTEIQEGCTLTVIEDKPAGCP